MSTYWVPAAWQALFWIWGYGNEEKRKIMVLTFQCNIPLMSSYQYTRDSEVENRPHGYFSPFIVFHLFPLFPLASSNFSFLAQLSRKIPLGGTVFIDQNKK